MQNIWYNIIAIIIDKINIVSLDFLVIMNLHFSKAKTLYKNFSIVLSRLLVVIFLGDFF